MTGLNQGANLRNRSGEHTITNLKRFGLKSLLLSMLLLAALALSACGGGGGDAPPGTGAPSGPVGPAIITIGDNLVTSESGTSASFQVVLNEKPTDMVRLDIISKDTSEGSVSPSAVYFYSTDWDTPQTIWVYGRDDTVKDGNITYNVTVSVNIGWTMATEYETVPAKNVSVTNSDDDLPGFTLTTTTGSTSENGTTKSIGVALNVAPTADVTIPVTVSDITEGLVSDTGWGGEANTINLIFTPANKTSTKYFYVHGQDDTIADTNQTYTIKVGPTSSTQAGYSGLLAKTVTMTNTDNEVAGITLSKTALSTSEYGTVDSFSVVLNEEPVGNVVIPVASTDTTEGLLSIPGQNNLATVSLTFTSANWDVPQDVSVVGQDDTILADSPTYNVTVGPATGSEAPYTALPQQTVAVTNTDNDVAAFNIIGSPVTLNTSDAGASATFQVVLTTDPGGTVVIPVMSGDDTEGLMTGGDSPGTQTNYLNLTFTSGDWPTAQTITVYGQPDNTVDGAQTYAITVGDQTVTVNNMDTDAAGFTVSRTTAWTDEGGWTQSFTVRLNTIPSAEVVIPVLVGNVAEGLITGGDSPTTPIDSLNLTFTALDWSTAQTVTIIGQDDNLDDGTVVYAISVGAPTGADTNYTALGVKSISVSNQDNDTSSFTVTPTSGIITDESGLTGSFAVKLTTKPYADVTIPVVVSNTKEVLVSGGDSPTTPAASINLTFTALDWFTAQEVTVTGQDDLVIDGPITYSITVGASSSTDALYNGRPARTVNATNRDNEVTPGEGSSLMAFNITGMIPYRGTVNTNDSYYMVTGLTWAAYYVTLANMTDDADLFVYSDSAFSSQLCFSMGTAVKGSEACATGSVGWSNTLYIRVSGSKSYQGAAFTLNVVPDPYSEGTSTGPIPLTYSADFPHAGTVDSTKVDTGSYYAITGMTTGTYQVVLSGATADVSLRVYGTADFASAVCTSGLINDNNEVCNISLTTGDTMWVRVSSSNTLLGAFFNLEILTPAVNEGAANATIPIVYPTALPFSGQVAAGGSSYYAISGLTLGDGYLLNLTNLTGNVTLTLDDQTNFNSPLCTSAAGGLNSEQCAATGIDPLYVRVSSTVGGYFDITIEALPIMEYLSGAVSLGIPDNNTTGVTSAMAVSGEVTSISKVIVQVDITHSYDADVGIYLTSPAGTRVMLSTNNGGAGNDYNMTIFDDGAANAITSGTAPFASIYRPEQLLSKLNGEDANGTWTLKVTDNAGRDVGTLNSWNLRIE